MRNYVARLTMALTACKLIWRVGSDRDGCCDDFSEVFQEGCKKTAMLTNKQMVKED